MGFGFPRCRVQDTGYRVHHGEDDGHRQVDCLHRRVIGQPLVRLYPRRNRDYTDAKINETMKHGRVQRQAHFVPIWSSWLRLQGLGLFRG